MSQTRQKMAHIYSKLNGFKIYPLKWFPSSINKASFQINCYQNRLSQFSWFSLTRYSIWLTLLLTSDQLIVSGPACFLLYGFWACVIRLSSFVFSNQRRKPASKVRILSNWFFGLGKAHTQYVPSQRIMIKLSLASLNGNEPLRLKCFWYLRVSSSLSFILEEL